MSSYPNEPRWFPDVRQPAPSYPEAESLPENDPLDPQTSPDAAKLDPAFAKLIGAEAVSATPERVEARLEVRPELLNRNGFLHGGAILAVADNLGGTTTFMSLAPSQTTTTIESKSSFFKVSRPIVTAEISL